MNYRDDYIYIILLNNNRVVTCDKIKWRINYLSKHLRLYRNINRYASITINKSIIVRERLIAQLSQSALDYLLINTYDFKLLSPLALSTSFKILINFVIIDTSTSSIRALINLLSKALIESIIINILIFFIRASISQILSNYLYLLNRDLSLNSITLLIFIIK